MNNILKSPINILESLEVKVRKEDAPFNSPNADGVKLALAELRKEGFLPVTAEELNITPLPSLSNQDPRQLSFL